MTEEKQAVKTLAESLVKAMKSVSKASSQEVLGGTTPGTISASRIVGLPAAFSSIISGVESAAAGGDAVAMQTLNALNHIAAGEFETITADTAMIDKVYATFADFITLVAEDATIGDLDVETIRAGLAEVGLLNIGSAVITTAQIERASTGTLFVRDEVGGKVYIDDLAVSDANIVNLAAGTVLINDSNGDLVELYVDSQGNVSTRAVSYDGTDIIEANTLNGNRIIQNSITTDRLNASEIFAVDSTVMNLIADDISATRLFANQGFIPMLETTVISSTAIGSGIDLTNNSSITILQDSINLLASNTGRTFIQQYEPIPVHLGDTWFNPLTEEHYVSTGIIIPQMTFGHDDGGNLCNVQTDDYQFEIDSSGNLKILVVNEEAEQIILDNDIDFSIVDDRIHANSMWKKVDNVAFSNLKISVDGIVSEVYDSQTGQSRITQNANSISAAVTSIDNIEDGTTAVPHVQTSSIEIKNNKVTIQSAGEVDIKASNFSISFNTAGSLTNKSRVDISNSVGIKISDSYGNYFQATSTKIGLYDIQNNARLYMDSNGNAVFAGSLSAATGTFAGSLSAATGTFAGTLSANCIIGGTLTLGGLNNTNGSLVINNTNNDTIVSANNTGLTVYNRSGTTEQFYIDNTTGDVVFRGTLLVGYSNYEDNGYYTIDDFYGLEGVSKRNNYVYSEGRYSCSEIELKRYEENSTTLLQDSYLSGSELQIRTFYSVSASLYPRIVLTDGQDTNNQRRIVVHPYYIESYDNNQDLFEVSATQIMTVGTKSRLVSTDQYSSRLLYCYETPSPMFGDVGEGQISSDGKCYIYLDPIFAQTISTDQYQVFLQKYGAGECYITERRGAYFVVEGTPNLKFGWEIKAKQSDYDQLRLERNDEPFSVPRQKYGEEALQHINELRREREENE